MQLSGPHQLVVYAHNNLEGGGGNIYITRVKNRHYTRVTSMELNADTIMQAYTMSCHQSIGHCNIKE
jgi:hypothetical protein